MLRRWIGVFFLLALVAGCQAGPMGEAVKPGLMFDRDAQAAPSERANAGDPSAMAWTRTAKETTKGRGPTTGRLDEFGVDDGEGDPSSGAAAPAVERLLIQRGEMRLEVVRPEDSAREFLAKIKAVGGYLQQQSGDTLTVRLPAAAFDDAFAQLRGMGRVLGEQREAEDVTEEFTDLAIRIDNARKARERLLEILKKAEKVDDILKVEAEVRRLTDEIERMEGRKKLLADQVAMSTLRVTFVPKTEAPPPPKRSRVRSRFEWINEAGPESLLEGR